MLTHMNDSCGNDLRVMLNNQMLYDFCYTTKIVKLINSNGMINNYTNKTHK